MTWAIGYTKPGVTLRRSPDGVLHANGIRLTDASGWMELPSPAATSSFDPLVSIRIRVAHDRDGHPFLYIDELKIEGQTYDSVQSWLVGGGAAWVTRLGELFHAEVERRLTRARTPRPSPAVPPKPTKP